MDGVKCPAGDAGLADALDYFDGPGASPLRVDGAAEVEPDRSSDALDDEGEVLLNLFLDGAESVMDTLSAGEFDSDPLADQRWGDRADARPGPCP